MAGTGGLWSGQVRLWSGQVGCGRNRWIVAGTGVTMQARTMGPSHIPTTGLIWFDNFFFYFFFIVNDNIVLYINTFHTETGPLCQALRSFTNL